MKYGMSLNIDEIAQVVDAEEADPDYWEFGIKQVDENVTSQADEACYLVEQALCGNINRTSAWPLKVFSMHYVAAGF
jgi:hypothetical protein